MTREGESVFKNRQQRSSGQRKGSRGAQPGANLPGHQISPGAPHGRGGTTRARSAKRKSRG